MPADRFEPRINVLQLVNGFELGGAEMALLELVRRLGPGVRSVVCSVGQDGPLRREFDQVADRVEVFEKRHRFDLGLVWKVARLLREERIDLLHTTLFYADVIGGVAAYLTRTPAFVSWHTAVGRCQNSYALSVGVNRFRR